MVRHFLKTLAIFLAMIILGLIGVFLIGRFDKGEESTNTINNQIPIAK